MKGGGLVDEGRLRAQEKSIKMWIEVVFGHCRHEKHHILTKLDIGKSASNYLHVQQK